MKNTNNYITVSILNTFIHNSIASEEMLRGVTVFGEISAYKISGNHAYFILKDNDAQINCNCFNYTKCYQPKDGESVLVTGNVDYYAKNGKLSFNVIKMEAVGLGILAIKLEQLKQKLKEEGLFKEDHKIAIPKFPSKICVLTSKTGAVIRDIITTVRKVNKVIDISIFDVKVQGIGAENTIISALKIVDKMGYDTIIIARGGGSFEELMPFNDEKLARAIYDANTPIISAVGHETDFTICDMAADLRAPTPTAAGAIIAYNQYELKRFFIDKTLNVATKINNLIAYEYKRFINDINMVILKMNGLYENKKHKIIIYKNVILEKINKMYNTKDFVLTKNIKLLEALNPMTILKKGFFKIKKDGKTVDNETEINKGDNIVIKGYNKNIFAEVKEVNLEDKYEIR